MLAVTSLLQLKATHVPDGKTFDFELEPDRLLKLGRTPQNQIVVSWDRTVSREHATLEVKNDQVTIRCLSSATNSIIYRGQPVREAVVAPGESFIIGVTQFEFFSPESDPVELMINDLSNSAANQSEAADADESSVEEFSYGSKDLQSVEFGNMSCQMEILAKLPRLIAEAQDDNALAEMLAGMLLDAIPQAVAVSAAYYDAAAMGVMSDSQKNAAGVNDAQLKQVRPALMRVRTRDDYMGRFNPSRRLVARALLSGDCAMHIWGSEQQGGGCTMSEDLNWAFCVPISGTSSKGWCLYVSGKGGADGSIIVTGDDFKGDLRFTQLLAQFLGSVRQVRKLQEQATQLSSFFSPKVVENLTSGSKVDILTPSERDITVLFCDVRGFSRKSEQCQGNLLHLLACVREALSVMTQGILLHDGAIADFQGDAALGFWGWPSELEEGAVPACLAALAVQAEFANAVKHSGLLDGFSVGIGVAHGRAIAGQIGTAHQAKIGVFGTVVNQGSRLEGMTRQFGVSICLDEASADFARRKLPREQARVRRLARVRPKGMDTAITVSELLPPNGPAADVSDDTIAIFEAALDNVISGHWEIALEALNSIPDDGPKAFLLKHMSRFDNQPPADWDGAFSLAEK